MSNGTVTSLDDPKVGKTETPSSVLKDGCYFIRYFPTTPPSDCLFYEGTLRVLHVGEKGLRNPNGSIRAGGDLYCRHREAPYGRDPRNWPPPELYSNLAKRPDPACVPILTDGIPVFPRQDYRYHLEVLKILEGVPVPGAFAIRFNLHAFERDVKWPNPGARLVNFSPVPPPEKGPEYPPGPGCVDPLHYTGPLIDETSGQIAGIFTLGWISPHLRQAVIVVDQVGVKAPKTPKDWEQAFEETGWAISCIHRTCSVSRPTASKNRKWTIAELHHALMLARRQPATETSIQLDLSRDLEVSSELFEHLDLLDTEWRYHLLCVPRIDGFDRGVMFDTYGSDSNNVPREAAAVAARWEFKETDPELQKRWGSATGALEDVPDAYFRVAVHEVGHAMGLGHNYLDNGFMATTDAIAEDGLATAEKAQKESEMAQQEAEESRLRALTAGLAARSLAAISNPEAPYADRVSRAASEQAEKAHHHYEAKARKSESARFPLNLQGALHFHVHDMDRLRFGPDVTVRPGTAFEDYGPGFADDEASGAEGVELDAWPLLAAVPLGAPVRIQLRLRNTSAKTQEVPRSLSLKTGVVSGTVTDPDGNDRTYWPVKTSLEDDEHRTLESNESITHALTLLRGAQKALFPMPGTHQVRVQVVWRRDGSQVFAEAATSVLITPAEDEAHLAAALAVISTPEALLSLAIGGDHLSQGKLVVQSTLSNPTLKPHFAIIEARRLLGGDLAGTNPETGNMRLLDACHVINGGAVFSYEEIDRIHELIASPDIQARVKKAAEGDPRVDQAVRSAIATLLEKIDKLLLQGNAEKARASELKDQLSRFQAGPVPRAIPG